MKTIILLLPSSVSMKKEITLRRQVRKFCEKNKYRFAPKNYEKWYGCRKGRYPEIIITSEKLSSELRTKGLSEGSIGELTESIIGIKKIRQYLLNNRKTNQEYYFVDNNPFGETNPDNWVRKRKADPEKVERNTNGKVVIQTPVHLLDDRVTCLNPDKPERQRTYRVKDSPKPYRKFDGQHRRHCSKCPFPEGCVMCTLP